MKQVIKLFYKVFKDIILRIRNIFKICDLLNQDTYYPEFKRKTKLRRFTENLIWILKYVELNKFYNLYGFDIKSDVKQDEYLNYRQFMIERNKKNGISNLYNYIVILRDKSVFEKYMNANNINTVRVIGILKNGVCYDSLFSSNICMRDIFKENGELFIKAVADECGHGIYYLKNYTEYKKVEDKISTGIYIIQKKLCQHLCMSKLNPMSINTLRIVTVRTNNDIAIFGILLRLGTRKSGSVDNSSAGGIVVPVMENGNLNEFGFSKPGYGGKVYCHPDTKIEFKKFEIPYFNESIELVKKAHRSLYNIHSIGWDVAITEEGPILIEGNDNWELQSLQALGGLKKKWKDYLN